MKVRKAVKKIVALGIGSVMVAGTLFGAAAADLGKFPGMFIEDDGSFNGLFVYGENAASSDVGGLGAITAAVQASAEKRVWVPTGTGAVSVEGGVKLVEPGDTLRLGQALSNGKAELDRNDLELLKDGDVRIGGTTYSYTQKLLTGGHQIKFDKSHSDFRDPKLYVDMASNEVWTYELDFSGSVDFRDIGTGRTIEMLNKHYTIDPKIPAASTATSFSLYFGDVTQTVNLGEQVTLDIDGKTYTIELVSANARRETPDADLKINGVTERIEEGETYEFGDLDVYVERLSAHDVPTLTASARLFIGSQEIEFRSMSATPTWQTVRVNGNAVNGIQSRVTGTNVGNIEKIELKFIPRDMRADDRVEYLLVGDSVVDPVFGAFEVNFVGPNLGLASEMKNFVEMQSSSNRFELSFTNYHGDEINRVSIFERDEANMGWTYDVDSDRGFKPLVQEDLIHASGYTTGDAFQGSATDPATDQITIESVTLAAGSWIEVTTAGQNQFVVGERYEIVTALEAAGNSETTLKDRDGDVVDLVANAHVDAEFKAIDQKVVNLKRDRIFALNQGTTTTRTKFYEVISISTDSSDQAIVTIRDLATGTDTDYRTGTSISGATIGTIEDSGDRNFHLILPSNVGVYNGDEFYLEGGKNYLSVGLHPGGKGYVYYVEEDGNQLSEANMNYFVYEIEGDDTNSRVKITAVDEDPLSLDGGLDQARFDPTGYLTDDSNDRAFALSTYGTFVEIDVDSDRRYAKLWTPKTSDQELAFNVFVNPVGADVSQTGQGYWLTEQVIIPGTATVKDTQVTNVADNNLIVIGGPCANTAALRVMGADPANCAAGFTPGKAKIKLYEMNTGKVALLVAGYSADDTLRAANVLNAYTEYAEDLDGKTEVEVTGTSLTDIEVGLPTVDVPAEPEDDEDDEDETTEE